MSSDGDPGATPLFIDTGVFYARFVETAQRHDRSTAVFEAIGAGDTVGYNFVSDFATPSWQNCSRDYSR